MMAWLPLLRLLLGIISWLYPIMVGAELCGKQVQPPHPALLTNAMLAIMFRALVGRVEAILRLESLTGSIVLLLCSIYAAHPHTRGALRFYNTFLASLVHRYAPQVNELCQRHMDHVAEHGLERTMGAVGSSVCQAAVGVVGITKTLCTAPTVDELALPEGSSIMRSTPQLPPPSPSSSTPSLPAHVGTTDATTTHRDELFAWVDKFEADFSATTTTAATTLTTSTTTPATTAPRTPFEWFSSTPPLPPRMEAATHAPFGEVGRSSNTTPWYTTLSPPPPAAQEL